MKIIKTSNFIKLSEATGDDQFPSSEPSHNKKRQGKTIFEDDSLPPTDDEFKELWLNPNVAVKKEKMPQQSL